MSSGVRPDDIKRGDVDNSSIILLEATDKIQPGSGKARLWVKNTSPNSLIFTNDTDVDSTMDNGYTVKEEGGSLGTFDTLNFDNTKFTVSIVDNIGTITPSTSEITVEEEGVSVGDFSSFNFVGSTITATDGGGGVADITFTPLRIQDGGSSIGYFDTLNFVGDGVTASDGGGGVSDITFAPSVPTISEVLSNNNDAGEIEITGLDTFLFVGGVNVTSNGSSVVGSTPANSVAIGESPSCTGTESVCIGNNASVTANQAVAIGNNTSITNLGGIATSYGASVTADYGIAMGYNSSCSGARGIAIGYQTSVSNSDAVAIGNSNTCSGIRSVTYGNNNVNSGAEGICLGNNSSVTHDYSVVASNNTDSRLDYETTFSAFRIVNPTVNTTDTTLTNVITLPLNADEVFSVDCFVTEHNTEGTVGTLNDVILYSFRNYHFRRKSTASATLNAGSSVTNNPDGASVSTVTLGVSGNDLVLNVTAADNDDRTWNVVMYTHAGNFS